MTEHSADIEFQITGGTFAGNYALDIGDITASDMGDLIAQGGPDLDAILAGGGAKGLRAIAAFVWVVRRRASKGLAYRAVADQITFDVLEMVAAKESAEKSLDPSLSAGA